MFNYKIGDQIYFDDNSQVWPKEFRLARCTIVEFNSYSHTYTVELIDPIRINTLTYDKNYTIIYNISNLKYMRMIKNIPKYLR